VYREVFNGIELLQLIGWWCVVCCAGVATADSYITSKSGT